jgi:2-dehydropantoate 2-reductase
MAQAAPRIAIVGAGAVGGYLGTRLASAGVDVTAVARGATADALRRHGWQMDSGGERLAAAARVATDARDVGPCDIVIVAVKAPAMAAAAPAVQAMLGADTLVMTAMNGIPWWFAHDLPALAGAPLTSIDPGGRILAAIPARHAAGGVVHLSASCSAPGVVRHALGNRLIVGEASGAPTARLAHLVETLRAAGIDVEVSASIHRDIWFKLWGNMTMNPVSALTGATMDRILDDPLVNRYCLAVMAEAAAIGAAIGCPIADSGEARQAVTRKLGAVRTSMLQDVDAGRPLEIDALVASVREIGQRVGLPTPNLDALLGLVRLKARVLGLYADEAPPVPPSRTHGAAGAPTVAP